MKNIDYFKESLSLPAYSVEEMVRDLEKEIGHAKLSRMGRGEVLRVLAIRKKGRKRELAVATA